jgi:D-inositol-3-phosphate glycosyltransferase
MKRLLWVGDAVVSSGFARSTKYILDVLRENWQIAVLGLNYNGDPHDAPYVVYPCWPGGDAFGLGRIKQLVAELKPDLIVLQNDPWNIPEYLKRIPKEIPVIAVCPVDGKNCRGAGLNGCAAVIFWTEFGLHEARLGGFTKPGYVIPLGVDLDIYKPKDKQVAREYLKLPYQMQQGFIVGNVNRNQPRKRLDLTIAFFCEWVKMRHVEDAYLYLHVAPTGDAGYDVVQLMHYYGLKGRLILNIPEIGYGETEQDLAETYATFDVQVNTGQGEGWGLTTLEGMACGIPQIVPDWSALGEWAAPAAKMIDCTSIAVTPNNINVVGGIPDQDQFMLALHELYLSGQDYRDKFSRRGIELANQPQYRWRNIGEKFRDTLNDVLASSFEVVDTVISPTKLRAV